MCKKIIAVTGPSGAGKTTITNKMFKDYGFTIPRHTTTREPRCDDAIGFYRYITLEQFDVYLRDNKFLIASRDNVRGYGILKSDCEDAWCFSDTIIINVSYKDVCQLTSLPYRVKIVVLTFKDIIQGVTSRLATSNSRFHSTEDIDYRIKSAQKDFSEYFSALERYATAIAYTDVMSESETYDFVKRELGLVKSTNEDENANKNLSAVGKTKMEVGLDFE